MKNKEKQELERLINITPLPLEVVSVFNRMLLDSDSFAPMISSYIKWAKENEAKGGEKDE